MSGTLRTPCSPRTPRTPRRTTLIDSPQDPRIPRTPRGQLLSPRDSSLQDPCSPRSLLHDVWLDFPPVLDCSIRAIPFGGTLNKAERHTIGSCDRIGAYYTPGRSPMHQMAANHEHRNEALKNGSIEGTTACSPNSKRIVGTAAGPIRPRHLEPLVELETEFAVSFPVEQYFADITQGAAPWEQPAERIVDRYFKLVTRRCVCVCLVWLLCMCLVWLLCMCLVWPLWMCLVWLLWVCLMF